MICRRTSSVGMRMRHWMMSYSKPMPPAANPAWGGTFPWKSCARAKLRENGEAGSAVIVVVKFLQPQTYERIARRYKANKERPILKA